MSCHVDALLDTVDDFDGMASALWFHLPSRVVCEFTLTLFMVLMFVLAEECFRA